MVVTLLNHILEGFVRILDNGFLDWAFFAYSSVWESNSIMKQPFPPNPFQLIIQVSS
jgi:hypothetical protein